MQEPEKNSHAFDAILKSKLTLAELESTMSCPDASMLAAFYERTLDAPERSHLEAHFAECSRCQAMLAAMARADDGVAVEKREERSFNWARLLGFGAPTFAAVIAVIVVYQLRSPSKQIQPMEMAMNSSAPAGAPQQLAAVANEAAAPAQPPAPAAPPAPAPPPAGAGNSGSAMVAGAAPMAAMAQPQKRGMFAAEFARPSASAIRLAQAEISPAPEPSPASEAPFRPTFTIRSPDHNAIWLIGPRGGIVKHTASGKIDVQQSNVTADLTQGAAVSARVAWIVGRNGTILRTSDGGAYWESVTSPTSEDLAHVRAADSKDAVIRTVKGASYATTDGGQTWLRQ